MTSDHTLIDGWLVPAAAPLPAGSTDTLFDLTAVGNWLEPFRRKSPNTHRAYQRCAAYWLYFLEQTHGPHADLLRRAGPADAHDFVQALTQQAPEAGAREAAPPARLGRGLTTATPPGAEADPARRWRAHGPRALPNAFGVRANPFASPKSARSVAQTVAALSSLYRFNQTQRSAREAALLNFNPFVDVGRFLIKQETKTDRLFEPAVYARLLATAEALREAAETPAQRERAARWRWMTVALFNLWLRISELARLRMGDFRLRGGVWFASVHGKGRKVRAVEVTPAVLRELVAYREALGLAGLPQRHESAFAAVTSLRRGPGDGPALTPRALFGEIKALGGAAAEALEREPAAADEPPEARVERAALAQRLRQLSPHWFRHSGASEAINAQFPIADAAERLGHQDPAITVRLYYHADARRRLQALESIEATRDSGERE